MPNNPLDCFHDLAKGLQNLDIYMQFNIDIVNNIASMGSFSGNAMQHAYGRTECTLYLRFRYGRKFTAEYGNPVYFISEFLPKKLFMSQVQQNLSLPTGPHNEGELYMSFMLDEQYLPELQKEISSKAQALYDLQFKKEIEELLDVGAEKYLEKTK